MKVLRARIAVAAIFFINGFSFASWVPRLPEVKLALDLSEGALGGALFAVAFGALLAMPLAGALATRFGSRIVTSIGLVLFLLAPIGWALAPSLPLLTLGFLAIGAAAGATDVAMNAQGVAVERAYGRSILSSLHGMFSLGGMSGALVAAVVIGQGVPLALHMAAVAGVALPLGLLASLALLPASHDARAGGPTFALPSRGLLALGAIAFCALLTEGAIGDWSAVYMTMSLGSPGEVAAIAFAAFQLTMAAGRFAGDRLITRFGRTRIARAGGLLAAAGLGCALVLAQPFAAIAGFALVGAGLAATFPITVSAAAERGDMAPGNAIAAIATLGYFGFMVGPPTIGAAAQALGRPVALALLPVLCLTIALLAHQTAPARTRPGLLRRVTP